VLSRRGDGCAPRLRVSRMTLIDGHQLRTALWRSQNWWRGDGLDIEKAADGLASELVMPVLMELSTRGVVVTDLDAIEAKVRVRVRAILERAVDQMEAEGLAVPGREGSLDRVLAAMLAGSHVGTEES
jgi:hypothetical protein